MRQFEIIDEAGNVHGPVTEKDITKLVDDRALGEQRHPDWQPDGRDGGWYLRLARETA